MSLRGIVQSPPSRAAERSIGRIFFLVLVALLASGLLAVPVSDRATVGYDLTVIGFALTVATLIWNWNE